MFVIKILLLTAILSTPVFCGSKKLYEQTCSTTEDCDQSLGLSCQNDKMSKICKCGGYTGETVYSLSKNRCVGAAGRECLKVQNISQALCVEDSICRDYEYMHLCACKDGFYQSKDGNCYLINKYGESCIEEEFSCGDTVSTSVSCIERKCRCLLGEENQHYNAKDNKCISYAGGQCLFHYSQSCTPNSYCGEINENIHGASFVVGHKCICSAGYSYTRNRECLARYGTNCDVNNPCNYNEHLGCMNGRCQCRNPLNEIYQHQTQQCSILVNSPCRIGPDEGPRCVENAECTSEKNSTKHGKCTCNAGYSPTPVSTCLLDINQKCQPNQNQCNFHNSLVCINGTCNCLDGNLSYDKVTRSCVSLIGYPCGSVYLFEEEGSVDQKKEITVLCEANASCSKISPYANGASKRICKPSKEQKNN